MYSKYYQDSVLWVLTICDINCNSKNKQNYIKSISPEYGTYEKLHINETKFLLT